MVKPLVSVLIPVYNAEIYLSQCLQSVISQTYAQLQIVLVDDGSNDGSWDIMASRALLDERIEIYHQENQGVAITRNNLLDKVKGDYLLFVDADDWIEPNMIEFLLYKMHESQADIVTCGNVINDEPASDDYYECSLVKNKAIERFLYHKEFRGSLCTKLMKTSLVHNCRFHCGITLGEDALFCWHALQNSLKVLFTDRQLYHYRMNDNSICHSSFSPKKLSAHFVWEQICAETEISWPQYLQIARARHCIEDVLLLRDAIKSNYSEDADIKLLQNTISKYRTNLYKIPITSFKMKVFAAIVSKFSCFAKFF